MVHLVSATDLEHNERHRRRRISLDSKIICSNAQPPSARLPKMVAKGDGLKAVIWLLLLLFRFRTANAGYGDTVGICKDQKQYFFFVFDLSRSITRRRGRVWKEFAPQRKYFAKAMTRFQEANPADAR